MILSNEIQEYINKNLNVDVHNLALKKNPFKEVSWNLILQQIQSKQKAENKLPTWFFTNNIIYPNPISIEQTSSEKLAQYKSENVSGKLIDLTGGFGVDSYYFSKKCTQVVYCEHNEELANIVAHNFNILKAANISVKKGDGTQILKNLKNKFDWIYIDPSRRDKVKRKVFLLEDCEPNVVELLPFYLEYSDNILIKTSPLLDLKAGFNSLKNVKRIEIIALQNEVKELLWFIEKNYEGLPEIKAVSIGKNNACKSFTTSWQDDEYSPISLPKRYLYEPNSALMKTGRFNSIANQYFLHKLHQHTHLYTSDAVVNFAGRVFEIQTCIPYSKKEIKQYIEGKQYNITTRNFPLSVQELRKKHKINEGGEHFAFFTTNSANQKIVILCNKVG